MTLFEASGLWLRTKVAFVKSDGLQPRLLSEMRIYLWLEVWTLMYERIRRRKSIHLPMTFHLRRSRLVLYDLMLKNRLMHWMKPTSSVMPFTVASSCWSLNLYTATDLFILGRGKWAANTVEVLCGPTWRLAKHGLRGQDKRYTACLVTKPSDRWTCLGDVREPSCWMNAKVFLYVHCKLNVYLIQLSCNVEIAPCFCILLEWFTIWFRKIFLHSKEIHRNKGKIS